MDASWKPVSVPASTKRWLWLTQLLSSVFFFFFLSFLPLFTLFCLRWLLCQRSQKQREKLMAKGTNEPLSVGPELVRHKGMSVKKSLDMWLLQTWLEGWLDGWFRMFLWGKAGLIFFFFFPHLSVHYCLLIIHPSNPQSFLRLRLNSCNFLKSGSFW